MFFKFLLNKKLKVESSSFNFEKKISFGVIFVLCGLCNYML